MTAPVVVFRWMLLGHTPWLVRMALPLPPRVAGLPATVSLPTTLATAVPPGTPLMLPLSGVVTIALLPTPTGGVVVVHVPVPVHAGSPPPLAVAVFVPLVALGPTVTGTRMMMVPLPAAVAIVQPVKVLPVAGQPLKVPLLVLAASLVGAADKLMPAGRLSPMLMAAVVGPLATVTVMS